MIWRRPCYRIYASVPDSTCSNSNVPLLIMAAFCAVRSLPTAKRYLSNCGCSPDGLYVIHALHPQHQQVWAQASNVTTATNRERRGRGYIYQILRENNSISGLWTRAITYVRLHALQTRWVLLITKLSCMNAAR